MKNTVIIDLNKDEITDILCEKSEDNSITLKFINAKSEGSNAGVEFYKPQTLFFNLFIEGLFSLLIVSYLFL